jgi:hypothetical protein
MPVRLGELPPPARLSVCSSAHTAIHVVSYAGASLLATLRNKRTACMCLVHCGVLLLVCFIVSVNSADCTTSPLTSPFRSTPFPPSINPTFSAKPTRRMPIPRGNVTVTEMERRVHGKPTICLVITSPESRDFCLLPAEDDFDEWKRALKLIGSVSTLHTPNTVAGSQRTVVVGEPVASWPPEDGRTWSPESAVRAVAAEAAVLAATDPDAVAVRRVVAASDKATASMASSMVTGDDCSASDAAELGRDVAAAVLSIQGWDWETRVERALAQIDEQAADFEAQLQHLHEKGQLPDNIRKVATEQLLDAVGAIVTALQGVLLQAVNTRWRRAVVNF